MSRESDITWGASTDVLVVGFGAAGAVAALQAHEDHARVMLIDRFGGGGTTALSGGVVYAGATRFQTQAGFADDVENMIAYLSREVGDAVTPATLRQFCAGSATDIDWLIKNGVAFSSEAYLEKTSFPPEGKYLYYSGNEKTPANSAVARPVPRGHRPVGSGFGGPHFHAALLRRISEVPIDVRYHCWATRLIVNGDNCVIGIELRALEDALRTKHQQLYSLANQVRPLDQNVYERAIKEIEDLEAHHSKAIYARAERGVILATGGYAFSQRLLREYTPAIADGRVKFHRLATVGNNGAGIELGRSAGGAVKRMGSLYIARHIVPGALTNGILVNHNGQRFIAEDAYISLIGEAIARQTEGTAWLIINGRTLRRALKQVVGSGWHLFNYYRPRILSNLLLGGTRRSTSLPALARAIGLSVENLCSSAADHDQDIKAGSTDRFGKSDDGRVALGDGPYYAINMSFANPRALTLLMTLGGLSVGEHTGEVLRDDGSAIKGLFAAGNCAAGLHSNGYISGLAIADCVFSGRRAGRRAAKGRVTEVPRV